MERSSRFGVYEAGAYVKQGYRIDDRHGRRMRRMEEEKSVGRRIDAFQMGE